MRCLSCQQETAAKDAKLFLGKLFTCSTCHALAESAQRQIDEDSARAKAQAYLWLEQRILAGGLLQGAQDAPREK